MCTPVLVAAANGKAKAFHCLMKHVDLNDATKNPIFKVLHVRKHQGDILKVSWSNDVYVYFFRPNLSLFC